MKLSQIFEAPSQNNNVFIGSLEGTKIVLVSTAGKTPKKLSLGSLRLTCYDVIKKISAVSKFNVKLKSFIVNIKNYKTALVCRYAADENILFINEIIPSSSITDKTIFSVLKISNMYEVFDDGNPLKYRSYTINETPHSFDRINDRNLKNIITREQVENILREAVTIIESLELLDFSVKHALIYSKSTKQSILLDVDHDTRVIDIATYFPNADSYVAHNLISITVD
jgi:hypothetical protein